MENNQKEKINYNDTKFIDLQLTTMKFKFGYLS